MLKHIYRRIITEDEYNYIQQISYAFTEEGLVDIQSISVHPVNNDIIGKNILSNDYTTLPYTIRLAALNVLIEDGVIEFP